jgi:hypothetical protein
MEFRFNADWIGYKRGLQFTDDKINDYILHS